MQISQASILLAKDMGARRIADVVLGCIMLVAPPVIGWSFGAAIRALIYHPRRVAVVDRRVAVHLP